MLVLAYVLCVIWDGGVDLTCRVTNLSNVRAGAILIKDSPSTSSTLSTIGVLLSPLVYAPTPVMMHVPATLLLGTTTGLNPSTSVAQHSNDSTRPLNSIVALIVVTIV